MKKEKQIKYMAGGILTIDNQVGNMMPMDIFVMLEHAAEQLDKQKASQVFYKAAEMQAMQIMDRYFKKSLFNKQTLKEALQRLEILGIGKSEILRFDLKNKVFLFKIINSSYAAQYKKLFGLSKNTVDYYWCGAISGILKNAKLDLKVEEKQCIVQGKRFCIIEARA